MISVDRQLLVEARIANESKSVLTAYVLWFFLGFFGMHRIYLQSGVGLFMIVLTIGGFVVMLSGSALGALLLAISAVILLADLFLIPGMVERQRNELREKLFAQYAQVTD